MKSFKGALAFAAVSLPLCSGSVFAYTLGIDSSSANKRQLLPMEVVGSSDAQAEYTLALDFGEDVRFGADRLFLSVDIQGALLARASVGADVAGCGSNVQGTVSSAGADGTNNVVFSIGGLESCNPDGSDGQDRTVTVKIELDSIRYGVPVLAMTRLQTGSQTDPVDFDRGFPSNGTLELASFARFLDVSAKIGEPAANATVDYVAANTGDANKFRSLTPGAPFLVSLVNSQEFLDAEQNPDMDTRIVFGDSTLSGSDLQVMNAAMTVTGNLAFLADDDQSAQRTLSAGDLNFAPDANLRSAVLTYAPSSAADLDDPVAGSGTPPASRREDLATNGIIIGGTSSTPVASTSLQFSMTYSFGGVTLPSGYTFLQTSPLKAEMPNVLREGSTFVFPWVSSDTLAQATLATNLFRISNMSDQETGEVTGRLLTSTAPAFTAPTAALRIAEKIDPRSEVTFNSETLEDLFGDYSRGDLEIFVESAAGNLTAKRLIVRAGDTVSVEAGTAFFYKDE